MKAVIPWRVLSRNRRLIIKPTVDIACEEFLLELALNEARHSME